MSGNRKNGKGKGREKDQGDTSAFQVDLSREKGKTIYIPGSFWGLKDADAEKLWECSVFQYDCAEVLCIVGNSTTNTPSKKCSRKISVLVDHSVLQKWWTRSSTSAIS